LSSSRLELLEYSEQPYSTVNTNTEEMRSSRSLYKSPIFEIYNINSILK